MSTGQRIAPCLWFDRNGEEAAQFYVSVFADSRIDKVVRSTVDYPGGRAGDVLVVDFTLLGQPYQALNGGPYDTFNDAISLSVNCADQAEVDRLWTALTADGGRPVQCGWLKDKYGVSWQIVPEALPRMLADRDAERAQRVMLAMMNMIKLDIDALQKAFDAAS